MDTELLGVRKPAKPTVRARVTVVDAEGAPVQGARVLAQPERTEADADVMPAGHGHFAASHGDRWDTTDDEGHVALRPLVADGAHTLVVQPPRDRPALREAVALTSWRPGDVTVRLRRWFVVRGVVQDTDGRPVVGAQVEPKVRGEDAPERAWTSESGAFEIERVAEGPIELVATLQEALVTLGGGGQRGPTASVTAAAGAEDVVIVLDVGKELVVRLEDPDLTARTKEQAERAEFDALATLWIPGSGGEGARASAHAYVRQGVARFRGLRDDETYALWITPSAEGRFWYQTDARAGDLRVTRRAGSPITVRVKAPANASLFAATVRGGYVEFDQARAEPPGPIVVRGVPEGRHRVWVWAKVGEEFWDGHGHADAGSTVEIEVKPPTPAR